MRLPGLWRARMAVGMATVALVAVLAPSTPARAASSEEARLLALTNDLRASVAAAPLTFDESLAGIARQWAAKMAADGTISHNPDLSSQVSGGWLKLAENVGMGPDIDTVHKALVASHYHYVNLTDTEVTLVGIGVVHSGSSVFLVEDFMQPSGGRATTPAPAPAPAPVTTTPPTTPAPRPTTPPTTAPPAVRTPPTTVPAPALAPIAAVAVPVAQAPSDWLALAIEVTRGWERATG